VHVRVRNGCPGNASRSGDRKSVKAAEGFGGRNGEPEWALRTGAQREEP